MRCNELTEAPLDPGDIRIIQTKIEDYQAEIEKLQQMKRQFDDASYNHPPELRNKLTAYISAYTREIAKLTDELNTRHKPTKFDNLIKGIQKNCSEALKYYVKSEIIPYVSLPKGQTALYSKPPTRPIINGDYEQDKFELFSSIIEKEMGIANFDNTVLVSTDLWNMKSIENEPYLFFPRNGFTAFIAQRRSKLTFNDYEIPTFFDYDDVENAWNTIIGDHNMYSRFQEHGGKVLDDAKSDIKTYSGFLGERYWVNNLETIGKMVEAGVLPEKWKPYSRWQSWISKDAIDNYFNFTTDFGRAVSYGNQALVKCSGFYAIHPRFDEQIRKALGINRW